MAKRKQILYTIDECVKKARKKFKVDVTKEKLLWLLQHKQIIDERGMVKPSDELRGLFVNKIIKESTVVYKEVRIKEILLFVTIPGKRWLMNFIEYHKYLFNLS